MGASVALERPSNRRCNKTLVASPVPRSRVEANNVLHNAGNVLNSVVILPGRIGGKVRDSKSQGLAKAVPLMNEHAADLGEFFWADP